MARNTPKKPAKRNKKSGAAEKRPKAEPRVSLAPLDFEDALEGLLAVKPAAEGGPTEDRAEETGGA